MDIFETIIAILLIAFMIINVRVTWILLSLARESKWRLPVLNERAVTATIKTVGSFLLAAVASNRLFSLHWGGATVLVILSVAVVLHSLPPIIWYYFLKTGRFHPSDLADAAHAIQENGTEKE